MTICDKPGNEPLQGETLKAKAEAKYLSYAKDQGIHPVSGTNGKNFIFRRIVHAGGLPPH